jgi:hypothetical protein
MSLLTWWRPNKPEDVDALKALVAAGSVVPRIDSGPYRRAGVVDALRSSIPGRGAARCSSSRRSRVLPGRTITRRVSCDRH